MNYDTKRIYDFTKEETKRLQLAGIRVIDDKHAKEICNALLNEQPVFISPIEVNINTMGVIDGQHRLQGYNMAWDKGYDGKIEVRFINIPEKDEKDVVIAKNTHSKNWTIKDFKHKLLTESNPSVVKLNNFCLEHDILHGKKKKNGSCPIKDRYGMSFLRGCNVTKELISGDIKISDEDVRFGEELYPQVIKLLDVLQYTTINSWFESFVQAWYDIRSTRRHDERLKKIGFECYCDKILPHFNREQVTSKETWKDRFVHVMECIELEKLNQH